MLHSDAVDTATGSNSGLSVLLEDTSIRAGIEPPTPVWKTCWPLRHSRTVLLAVVLLSEVHVFSDMSEWDCKFGDPLTRLAPPLIQFEFAQYLS